MARFNTFFSRLNKEPHSQNVLISFSKLFTRLYLDVTTTGSNQAFNAIQLEKHRLGTTQ
jgi:hypothetical protein